MVSHMIKCLPVGEKMVYVSGPDNTLYPIQESPMGKKELLKVLT